MLIKIVADLLGLIEHLLTFYVYILIAAVIISWVNADPYNQLVRIIRNITEPVLAPARRLLWPWTRQLQVDLSPMLVIVVIYAIQIVIRRIREALYFGF